ncbi:MAG: KDO2-lipid IV(A) lauroyltransferase, partial [Candidatus Omnitrophota bacterium]
MSSTTRSIKRRLSDVLLSSLLRFVQLALRPWPIPCLIHLGDGIGWILGHCGKRRFIGLQNLRRVFGTSKSPAELNKLIVLCYQNLVMTGLETLRLPYMTKAEIMARVSVKNKVHFDDAVNQNKGIVLLTAHFGNWEVANAYACLTDIPLAVLVRPQKEPLVDAFLNSIRAAHGAEIIRRGMNLRRIKHVLKAGGIVGILADQDAGKSGVYVKMFNRQTSFPRGVAHFARMTGAKIIPTFCIRRKPFEFDLVVHEPLDSDVSDMNEDRDGLVMQKFAELLESHVMSDPHLWLWPHRRWKSSPDRLCLIISDSKIGHIRQSRCIANEWKQLRASANGLGDARVKEIATEFKSPNAKKIFEMWVYLFRGGACAQHLLKWALSSKIWNELQTVNADIIISCGSGTEAINITLKHMYGAKNIFVQKPQFSINSFDAIIVPEHDLTKKNKRIFPTYGAVVDNFEVKSVPGKQKINALLHVQDEDNVISLFIGGPDKAQNWHSQRFIQKIQTLERHAQASCIKLVATTSRRTPKVVIEALGQSRELGLYQHLILVNESNPSGGFEAMLTVARTHFVTMDSISMISEVIGTGKPVVVVTDGSMAGLRPKIRRFLN